MLLPRLMNFIDESTMKDYRNVAGERGRQLCRYNPYGLLRKTVIKHLKLIENQSQLIAIELDQST